MAIHIAKVLAILTSDQGDEVMQLVFRHFFSALFQALWIIALIGLAPSVSFAAPGGFSGDVAVIDPESENVAVVCDTCQSVSDFRDAVAARGAYYPEGFYSVFTGSTQTGTLLKGTMLIMEGWPTRTVNVFLGSPSFEEQRAWEDINDYLQDFEPVIHLPPNLFTTVLDDFAEPDLLQFLNGHPSIRSVLDARRTASGLIKNFFLLANLVTPDYVIVVWSDGSRAVYKIKCASACVTGIGTLELVEDSAVDANGNPVLTEPGNDASNAPVIGNFDGNSGYYVPPPSSSSCYFCPDNGDPCLKVPDELCEQ